MENMCPMFESLSYLNLLSQEEIKKEIKKRQHFEYKIVRRKKSKKFFLEYIQSDYIFLEKIRRQRISLKCDLKKNEIEFKIVPRISRLWMEVIKKWGDDMKVWASFAAFLKKWKRKGQLSSLCRLITSIHGDKMHTWLLAAKWQFEECDSPDECRKYLLQACTKFEYDVRILVELFHAEMLTAEKKLTQNRKIGDEISEDEHEYAKAPMIVYRTAREKHPSNSEICFAMMDIANKSKDAFAEKVVDDIKNNICESFSSQPSVCSRLVWIRMEKKKTTSTVGSEENTLTLQSLIDDKAISEMQELVQKSDNNENMRKEFVLFLKKLASSPVESCKIASRRLQKLKQEVENQPDFDMFSDEETIELVQYLNSEFCYHDTLDVLNKKSNIKDKATLSFIKLQALVALQSEEADSYFFEALSYMKENASNGQLVEKFFLFWMQTAVGKSDSKLADDICFKHASTNFFKADFTYKSKLLYLKKVCMTENVEQAYKAYKRVMESFGCTEEFHLRAVDMFASANLKQASMDSVHNFGVSHFGGASVEVWLKQCRWLRNGGRGGAANSAWRNAQHKLRSDLVQNFLERATSEVFNAEED